jgi:hypothetical protein
VFNFQALQPLHAQALYSRRQPFHIRLPSVWFLNLYPSFTNSFLCFIFSLLNHSPQTTYLVHRRYVLISLLFVVRRADGFLFSFLSHPFYFSISIFPIVYCSIFHSFSSHSSSPSTTTFILPLIFSSRLSSHHSPSPISPLIPLLSFRTLVFLFLLL